MILVASHEARMPGERISMMLWVLAGVSVLLGFFFSFSVSKAA